MVDDLPLYVACFELVKYLYLLVDHYPKNYKYSLGGSTLESAWLMLDEVMAANVARSRPEKRMHIEAASLAFDRLKTRVRMGREIKLFDDRRYGHVMEQNEEIGKMLAGWLRWAKTTA